MLRHNTISAGLRPTLPATYSDKPSQSNPKGKRVLAPKLESSKLTKGDKSNSQSKKRELKGNNKRSAVFGESKK